MFDFLRRWFAGSTPAPIQTPELLEPAALPAIPALSDYAGLYAGATGTKAQNAAFQASVILANKSIYETAGAALGVPWWWVGCIHWMEASGDFTKHLHNGDPLTRRTVHYPAGRPVSGSAPFTWAESASDALEMRGLSGLTWTIATALHQAEMYNGMGYCKRGIRSPYLWSATTWEQPGRYVADGVWSDTATSSQVGVAAMMLALQSQVTLT